jgi:hypothetical protein
LVTNRSAQTLQVMAVSEMVGSIPENVGEAATPATLGMKVERLAAVLEFKRHPLILVTTVRGRQPALHSLSIERRNFKELIPA